MEEYKFLLDIAIILAMTKSFSLVSKKFNMPPVVGALITVEDLESDDEEGALLLYRYNEDPEDPDTFSLDNIETDEEYETVTAVLDEILEDEE